MAKPALFNLRACTIRSSSFALCPAPRAGSQGERRVYGTALPRPPSRGTSLWRRGDHFRVRCDVALTIWPLSSKMHTLVPSSQECPRSWDHLTAKQKSWFRRPAALPTISCAPQSLAFGIDRSKASAAQARHGLVGQKSSPQSLHSRDTSHENTVT